MHTSFMRRAVACLALLLTLALFGAPSLQAQEQQDRPEDVARAAVQARYGWPAVINLDSFYLSIDKSPAGLEKYLRTAEWVRARALEMRLEECHATITFDRPLTLAELRDLITDYGIRPRLTYSYTDADGTVETLMSFVGGGPGSEVALTQIGQFSREKDGWVGVVALVGVIPGDRLEDVAGDPRVYLVDVVADEAIAYNPGHGDYMQPLSWHLYHNRRDAAGAGATP